MMTRTAAYARYSSDAQREASIRDQLRNIDAYCKRMGWPASKVFQDQALSGSRSDRPAYQAMLAAVDAGLIDVLLVDDFSRLSRDNLEATRAVRLFVHHGVRLIGVSDGVDTARRGSKLDTGFRALINELYLDDLAEKTHRGMTGQALDGYSTGGLPYGYDSLPDGQGHRRVVNAEEAEWVRWIFERYVQGDSPRAIADQLNRLGVPSPRGGTWVATALYPDVKGPGILGNEIYAGTLIWNRTKWSKHPETGRRMPTTRPRSEWVIKEAPELRIIDQRLWDAAQARTKAIRAKTSLQRNGSSTAKSGGGVSKYVFSGLLRCGCCGGAYVIVDRTRYGCATNKDRGDAACANRLKVKRAVVEERLLAGIKRDIMSEEAYQVFEDEVARLLKASQPDPSVARKAEAKARTEVDNILNAIRQGIVTPSTRRALEEAEAKLLEAQERVQEMERFTPTEMIPRAREAFTELVANLEKASDVAATREAVREIVGQIKLVPDGGELVAEMTSAGLAGACQMALVAGAGFEPATFGL